MNQRRESRLQVDAPVILTVLKVLGEPIVSGIILDVSGSGLQVRVRVPMPCGACVRIEVPDLVMFGEVRRCEPVEDNYSVGISLSEISTVLDE